MNNTYILNFISQKDFENHVFNTLKEYRETLKAINLEKFNSNIIDPIKLLFDKNVFRLSYEEVIKKEIDRQKDKTNNNSIGYFHQNIFQYIKGCIVPDEGWDIICNLDNGEILYVEMKNKHNTMNSSSSARTYMRMQNHLLVGPNKEKSICALVEIIARHSQNIPWIVTLDKIRQYPNEKLRRISIDKFYELVTGEKNAFKDLCYQLPITIEKILTQSHELKLEKDSVLDELQAVDTDILKALYKLAFSTYEGFDF